MRNMKRRQGVSAGGRGRTTETFITVTGSSPSEHLCHYTTKKKKRWNFLNFEINCDHEFTSLDKHRDSSSSIKPTLAPLNCFQKSQLFAMK